MLEPKEEILLHYQRSMEYVESLRNLREEDWHVSIEKGKWTVAEIIAHFKPWDDLVVDQRVMYFLTNQPLPKLDINIEDVNKVAASYGKTHSKEETIDRFLEHRQRLMETVEGIDQELFTKEVVIGEKKLTIYDYFCGLASHDEHHFKQIDQVLVSTS